MTDARDAQARQHNCADIANHISSCMCVIDEPARTCIAASLPSNRAPAPDLRRGRGLRCCAPARGDASLTGRRPQVDDSAQTKSFLNRRYGESGTSYLRKLLNAHPDIYMCEPDEPSYFVDARQLRTLYPEMWERGLWRSEERYLDLFRPAGAASILGEASTAYAKLPLVPGVPERIGAFNREARFIYLLRDPVERAISHYWHMARHHAEHRPIAEAIRRDPQFVVVSHYAMQLRPFLERFGRDRVLVLVHEQLVADPTGVMGGVYQWLGVDAAAADLSGFSGPENATPDAVSMPGWGGVPRRLRQAPALKSAVVRLPPAVHQALHRLTTREVLRRAVDVTAAVAFLLPEQRRQTDELAELLGCSFPEWTTLYGASLPCDTDPAPRQPSLGCSRRSNDGGDRSSRSRVQTSIDIPPRLASSYHGHHAEKVFVSGHSSRSAIVRKLGHGRKGRPAGAMAGVVQHSGADPRAGPVWRVLHRHGVHWVLRARPR